jgi:hypothetical protein
VGDQGGWEHPLVPEFSEAGAEPIEKGLPVEPTAPYTFCDFQPRRDSASSDVVTSSLRHPVTPRPRFINANYVEPETRALGVPLLRGSSRNALEA